MRINCRFRIEVTGRRGRQGKISRSSESEMGKSVPVSSAKLYFFPESYVYRGLHQCSVVKNPPAMQEMWVRSLGQEYPLEEEMATHFSTLSWRIPWTEEPGWLQPIESQRVGHDWSNFACTCLQKSEVKSLSRVQLFAQLFGIVQFHGLSISRPEYWSALPFPSPMSTEGHSILTN